MRVHIALNSLVPPSPLPTLTSALNDLRREIRPLRRPSGGSYYRPNLPMQGKHRGNGNFIFNFPDGSTQPGFEGQPTCGTANTACSGCVCVPDSEADFTCDITENVPMWRLFDGGYGNACRLESFTLATCPPL
eukprot:CAMPEP_0174889990 /NCGR_PEP_ID=MMETSP0167-20121228/5170_1 /TAXON_ID=38298 /ORGANISM="Rhodella maculata, Strain CCMP736" /LENGTH=132 /DNA_ID=CAMNT_0016127605 /DNA_START=11 /DNA_END=410 /DNA_ORIENTATION=-